MNIEAITKALEGVTPDRVERLWWFLHILSKSSGSTNADDDNWNWINAFCSDYEDDTFNRAEKLGFIKVSHDSFMETSKAGMTPAGFSFINYFEKAPSVSLISEIDRLQRENDDLRPYKNELLRLAEAVGEKDDPFAAWENLEPAIARAEAAEAEVTRLQAELALSKPLYSRRQIEARVKLLEEALKPVAEKYESIIPDAADVAEGFATHPDNMQDDQLALITLRIGDLRRAKALASTGGEHHGN